MKRLSVLSLSALLLFSCNDNKQVQNEPAEQSEVAKTALNTKTISESNKTSSAQVIEEVQLQEVREEIEQAIKWLEADKIDPIKIS